MYQIPSLLRISGLFHAFSCKTDGNMSYIILGEEKDFEVVTKNRKIFLQKAKIDISRTITMWVEPRTG